jgi:DNA-binding transcriptional regulator YbjK
MSRFHASAKVAKMSRMPQQERSQVRRDALLRAAVELIGEGGTQAISHRAVAARAGLPPSTIGYFYSSIDDLTAEALRVYSERAVADYLRLTTEPAEVGDVLRAVSRLPFDPQFERAQMIIYLDSARSPEIQAAVGTVLDGYRRVATQLLESMGLPAAEQASVAVVALFDGFTLQRLARPDAPPSADLLADALHALLVGFLANDKERRTILSRLTPTVS